MTEDERVCLARNVALCCAYGDGLRVGFRLGESGAAKRYDAVRSKIETEIIRASKELRGTEMNEAMKYCEACQASPKHGYCNLPGCLGSRPSETKDCGCGLEGKCPDPPVMDINAAIEMMLAYEQAGGDGWWKGWEALKAAYPDRIAQKLMALQRYTVDGHDDGKLIPYSDGEVVYWDDVQGLLK
jgi:hypothetical protein